MITYTYRTITIRPPYRGDGNGIAAQIEILRRRNGKPISNREYLVTERQLAALIDALRGLGKVPQIDIPALRNGEFIVQYFA